MNTTDRGDAWAPQACTLPTTQRPLRVAEFDDLFATALRRIEPYGQTRLRLVLDGASATEALARDLTQRESECCSFFTFDFSSDGEELIVDVTVPAAQAEVLRGLRTRAAALVAVKR